jgi:hypothetical protein
MLKTCRCWNAQGWFRVTLLAIVSFHMSNLEIDSNGEAIMYM